MKDINQVETRIVLLERNIFENNNWSLKVSTLKVSLIYLQTIATGCFNFIDGCDNMEARFIMGCLLDHSCTQSQSQQAESGFYRTLSHQEPMERYKDQGAAICCILLHHEQSVCRFCRHPPTNTPIKGIRALIKPKNDQIQVHKPM
jgi:hypothetical protein